MPRCELITIGSELLNGSVLNTNAQFLARQVSALDIDVVNQVTCRDNEVEIMQALRTAIDRANLIFVTGGLGPTPDDITRDTIARFFGCGLEFDPRQYRQIVKFFKTIQRETPAVTRQEAFRPAISKPLVNRFGIALGFYITIQRRLLIVLPGVPRELKQMFDTAARPLITRTFPNRARKYSLEARIAGLHEPQIMNRLGKRFFRDRDFEFGIYPAIGEVTIRLKSKDKRLLAVLKRELREVLGLHLFSFENETISEAIGRELVRKRLTLSCVESCTGGLFAKLITDASGASKYFKGSAVAYDDKVKSDKLGVPKEVLSSNGAVSGAVARALANGAQRNYGTSLAISITGIAGPLGGSKRKPVGLIYVGMSSPLGTQVFEFRFSGERSRIRLQATQRALFVLWKWLKS
jgi:nicotinamide-nucleotide amidase